MEKTDFLYSSGTVLVCLCFQTKKQDNQAVLRFDLKKPIVFDVSKHKCTTVKLLYNSTFNNQMCLYVFEQQKYSQASRPFDLQQPIAFYMFSKHKAMQSSFSTIRHKKTIRPQNAFHQFSPDISSSSQRVCKGGQWQRAKPLRSAAPLWVSA